MNKGNDEAFEKAYATVVENGWANVKHMARQVWDLASATPPAAQVQGEREAFEASGVASLLSRDTEPGYTDQYASPATNMAWRGWQARAALSAPPAAGVPEGWKLVPAVITSQMEDAYDQKCQADKAFDPGLYLPAYDALLGAAPTPPASEQQQAVVMPEREVSRNGCTNLKKGYGGGWNACLDELLRLNPNLQPAAPSQGE